jgi:hypothetical protein
MDMRATWGTNETTIRSVGDLDAVVSAIRKSGQPTMLFLQAASYGLSGNSAP